MQSYSQIPDEVKHTAAHILAAAVTRLFPKAKIGIGPVTKEGFYYDFDLSRDLTEKDIQRIELEMERITESALPMEQIVINREEALNMLLQRGQIYKAELVRNIPDPEISFYKTGDKFIDLCRGPHVYSTREVGPIKIVKIEETHWNEDPSRPKMQRVYGIVFNSQNDLQEYFKTKKEEKERDYKSIIKSISIGSFNENKIQLNEKGSEILRRVEINAREELLSNNYKEIQSGPINNANQISQQFDEIFDYKIWSPKEFPITFTSVFYVNEAFFKAEKIQSKILTVKRYIKESESMVIISEIGKIAAMFKRMNIEFKAEISYANPEEILVATISNILQKEGVSHTKIISNLESEINILLKAVDLFGREWNVGEVILERNVVRKNLTENITTLEHKINLTAILAYSVEHTKGDLPSSLAPYEIIIIPINKNFFDYSYKIYDFIKKIGTTSMVDVRSISLKRKIYLAGRYKSTIQLIIGEKEKNNNSVSIRHKNLDLGLISIENLETTLNNLSKIEV